MNQKKKLLKRAKFVHLTPILTMTMTFDLKGHITNIKHVVKRFDYVTWMESVSASGKEI